MKPAVALGVLMGVLAQDALGASGLMALYAQAAERDARLMQAQAQYQAESEVINKAQALLMPKVNGELSYNSQNSSRTSPFTVKEGRVGRITVEQPLFNGEALARYDQAKATLEQARMKLTLSEQDLILRLTQSYFDVLRADQLLELAMAQLEATGKQKEKIAEGVRVGLTNPVDLLEVQARYDLALSDRIAAENQTEITREALARLLGTTPPNLKTLPLMTRFVPWQEKLSDIERQAQDNNLQVRLNAAGVQVAEQEVSAQRAGHMPALSVQGNWTDTSNVYAQSSAFAIPEVQTSSIGLKLTVPLYSGGLTSASVREAESKLGAARYGLRDVREQARLDAASLMRSIQRAPSQLQALQQAVASSRAFLEAAEEGNRVGLKDLVEVLNARAQLMKAERDLANALYDDVLNRFRLKAVLGNLTTDDLATIEAHLRDAAT